MKKSQVLTATLLASLVLSYASPLLRATETSLELSRSIVRFHVVAQSDSVQDQANKLFVRDAVKQLVNLDLEDIGSQAAALEYLQNKLPAIERRANQALQMLGAQQTAKADIERRMFPLKTYGDLTIPAGMYTSLTLTIGSGKGSNWWCVMYPPLCYGVEGPENTKEVEAYLKNQLSPQAFSSVKAGETAYRFRIVEQANWVIEQVDKLKKHLDS